MSNVNEKDLSLPGSPKDYEKYQYTQHKQLLLTLFSIVSFAGILYSSFLFFSNSKILYFFYPFLILTTIYFIVSVIIQGFGRPFDTDKHISLVEQWKPKKYPSVDIFLPVCGEDINILRNSWEGVQEVSRYYRGKTKVYCLDDADDKKTAKLAKQFGYKYLLREDRGVFKKAGNLRHGFNNSNSEFIVVFDADFRPRSDILNELLPYFDNDKNLGIVQSPQYFDTSKQQVWLQRGAGAVQEYFYRSVQQNRHINEGAICVGSNAVYKREALRANGGSTLIEHSEDVHTGFDLRRKGWSLFYVPIILAKGICPTNVKGFFRQQYRWCRGSMSLLGSKKFWNTKMSLRSRLCYISGFLYYINTAIYTIIGPLVPLALIFVVPDKARLINYLPLLPSILYMYIVFPLWHKSDYRFETFSVKVIYGWAHLIAVFDSIFHRSMGWVPTGGKNKKSNHYNVFVFGLVLFSLTVGLIWVASSLFRMTQYKPINFVPVLLSGLVYLAATGRVVKTVLSKKTS